MYKLKWLDVSIDKDRFSDVNSVTELEEMFTSTLIDRLYELNINLSEEYSPKLSLRVYKEEDESETQLNSFLEEEDVVIEAPFEVFVDDEYLHTSDGVDEVYLEQIVGDIEETFFDVLDDMSIYPYMNHEDGMCFKYAEWICE